MRKQFRVSDGYSVRVSKIDTESELAVFFGVKATGLTAGYEGFDVVFFQNSVDSNFGELSGIRSVSVGYTAHRTDIVRGPLNSEP